MADKKTYLFLFSIAPVQAFIAQARKTQDLYAGSKILTELSRRGLQELINFHNATSIFPSNIEAESIPNRFLVEVGSDNIKEVGQKIEAVVRAYWREEISAEVIKYDISRKEPNGVKGIKEQIDNHLDINWAFVDIDTEGGYVKAYEKIERLLGAVKNARSFTQFNYQIELGEKGRKCSVDGERNVKFYRLSEKEVEADVLARKLFVSANETFINPYNNGKFLLSDLQPGEGLSAVSMVKRLFKTSTDFKSTADIAMFHVTDYLLKNQLQYILPYRNEFAGFDGIKFNAQLYFEENLNSNYFRKQGYNSLEPKIESLKKQLSKLKDLSENNGYKFCKYYAIIDFDGDSMGKFLGGDENKVKNGVDLKEFHKALSSRLAAFAKEAKDNIVDKYGQTVYAGGDDFLGFVNLNYLFLTMQELRNKFKKMVNDELQALGYLNDEISFSAGICIAHYKEPLSMVLGKAAAAQKTAKADKKGERNAFTIVASKHSVENHETYFKWGNNCENVRDLEKVKDELITKNRYSNTFIKSLNIEFAKLTDKDGRLLVSRDLLKDEVERLLKRSFMGKKEDKKVQSEAFGKVIMNIYDNANNNFDNFINALNICDFMHRLLDSNEGKAIDKLQLQIA